MMDIKLEGVFMCLTRLIERSTFKKVGHSGWGGVPDSSPN